MKTLANHFFRIPLTLSQEEEIGMSHNYHVGMEFQSPHVFSTATGMKVPITVCGDEHTAFHFILFFGTNLTRRVPLLHRQGGILGSLLNLYWGMLRGIMQLCSEIFLSFLSFLSWSFLFWCCCCCFLFVPNHIYGFLAFPLHPGKIYISERKIQETSPPCFPQVL